MAAAADLQFAFEDIARAYERTCDCEVVLTFGSSGKFAAQIKEGLPVDVFASANMAYVDDLDREGLVIPETKQLYAVGRIVLAVPADSTLQVRGLADLRDPAIRRVAVANPEHAPYGMAAREALENAGLWKDIQSKLVLGENAAQTTQFVEAGDAQAGILPLSLAIQRKGHLRYVLIDDSLHNRIAQAAAVLARSDHPDLALGFIEFVNGPEGRPIMEKYGFLLPGEERGR